MVKGAMKYTPKEIVLELEDIKRSFNLTKDSQAFKKMVDFSRVGKEIIIRLQFERKRK